MRWLHFLFIINVLWSFSSCKNTQEPKENHRGFYYWKTAFALPANTRDLLHRLEVGHLYIKVFDVSWDASAKQAVPVGLLDRKDAFPVQLKITPVVFVTLEALRNTPLEGIPVLAQRMATLLGKLTRDYEKQLSGEVQIDCDWTVQTKDSYFRLLEALKKQSFFQKRELSVTIRLHQAKFINESGIPPADRGLLMCYNMGNLRDPAAENSIIDPAVFKSYTGRLDDYPLPLDIALPLFDWWVWFRNQHYYGLVHAGNLPASFGSGKVTDFRNDTLINGYRFLSADRLRHEYVNAASIEKVINLLPGKLKSGKNKVILFHLDSMSLSNYTIHELENFYRPFD